MTRERRVLGGCGDEDDLTGLDTGQQGVLLGLGEAVDLVEEEDRLPVVEVAVAGRRLHDGADVLDPRCHCGQLDELAVRRSGDEVGQGRLAGAGRTPEDGAQRSGRAARALDEPAQWAARSQDVRLAADLLDGGRTHADRQRGKHRPAPLPGGSGEEVVGGWHVRRVAAGHDVTHVTPVVASACAESCA